MSTNVDYARKYDLPTVPDLMKQLTERVADGRQVFTFRPNCLSNASAMDERAGRYYFSPGTTKFFNARYYMFHETGVFAHSVKRPCEPRVYRVSWIDPTGNVTDLWRDCATLRTAENCARYYHRALVDAGLLGYYKH